MAKIVDVTDVPEMPGAGLLHFDDGRPPLMALPEIADEHRERLGISAMRDGTAGNGVVGWLTTPKTGLDPHAGDGPVPASVQAPPPAAPAPAAPAPAPPPAQGVGGSTAAAPAPPAPPEDPAIAASNARLAQDLMTGRQGGGAPTPVRPAGFSPDIKKVVTETGPAYDTRAAGERLDAGAAVLDAQMAKAATEKNIAEATAAHAQAQNLAAQQEAARQKAEIIRKQQAYQQQNQAYQRDLDEYTQSAAPNPQRYFENKGVISSMLSVIGQGLGAFGASLSHTQNFAFEAAQADMRADMAAQQATFEAGRADRKNALSRFVDFYHGDMDMAKSALAQAQLKVAETETSRFAAQSQSKAVTANAQVLAAQFQQAQLLEEQKRAELAAGKTTTTVEDKYHQASGGGPGGKPLSLEQELAIRKFLKPKEGKDQGALGLTARTVATVKSQYGTKKEQIARLYSALDEEAKLLGLGIDKETGTLIDPASGRPARQPSKSPGIGYVAGHIPDALAGEEGRALRRARANSARLHAQTIYDKSITAEEAEHEIPTVMGDTPADEMNSLKQRLHELSQYDYQLDTTAASIDPRLVNERTQAKRDVSVARATGSPLQGPSSRQGAGDAGPEVSEGDGG